MARPALAASPRLARVRSGAWRGLRSDLADSSPIPRRFFARNLVHTYLSCLYAPASTHPRTPSSRQLAIAGRKRMHPGRKPLRGLAPGAGLEPDRLRQDPLPSAGDYCFILLLMFFARQNLDARSSRARIYRRPVPAILSGTPPTRLRARQLFASRPHTVAPLPRCSPRDHTPPRVIPLRRATSRSRASHLPTAPPRALARLASPPRLLALSRVSPVHRAPSRAPTPRPSATPPRALASLTPSPRLLALLRPSLLRHVPSRLVLLPPPRPPSSPVALVHLCAPLVSPAPIRTLALSALRASRSSLSHRPL